MRILALNGSPFKNGKVSKIINAITESIPKTSFSETIHVYDMKISPCRGCNVCRKSKKCVMKDDMQQIHQKIQQADIIIVGTPTYWANMSGPLKTLFDRSVGILEDFSGKLPKPLMKGKKAILVTSCNSPKFLGWFGMQHGQTLKNLSIIMKSSGYKIIKKIAHTSSIRYLGQPVPLNPRVIIRSKKFGAQL